MNTKNVVTLLLIALLSFGAGKYTTPKPCINLNMINEAKIREWKTEWCSDACSNTEDCAQDSLQSLCDNLYNGKLLDLKTGYLQGLSDGNQRQGY